MQVGDELDVLCAVLVLWQRGHDVDVCWWRETRRSVRVLVAALYLCAAPEKPLVPQRLPPFERYARRFSEAEKVEREEELAFVTSQKSAIARVLVSAYDANSQGKRGYKAYTKAAEGAKMTDLPCR